MQESEVSPRPCRKRFEVERRSALSRALLLVVFVAVHASGCVTKPTDGQEVSSRSSVISYELLYPENDPVVAVYIAELKQNGTIGYSQLEVPVDRGYFMTDAIGVRWKRATTNIAVHVDSWYANNDPNSPWMKRFWFQHVNAGGPTASYTFQGKPNGDFSDATASCLQQFQSRGGVLMAANCGHGNIVTVYARGN